MEQWRIQAARQALAALGGDSDGEALATELALTAPASGALNLRPLIGRTIEGDSPAVAAALAELCVLVINADGHPRNTPEIARDLAVGVIAMVRDGHAKRAGELLNVLIDDEIIARATAEGAA